MRLDRLPFLERLAPCERILLAGAGGGFDIVTAVPLFRYLRAQGKEVFLASLSFSDLSKTFEGRRVPNVFEVRPDSLGDSDYFPEKYLAQWLAEQGEDITVYCFKTAGAQGLRSIYQELLAKLKFDAVVLCDGGTDSLMRGDEPGLGSPAEDIASIAAVSTLEEVPVKLLACLGFGVDFHHGVCHGYVLEAVSDLTASGHFLGAFSLLPPMSEFLDLRNCLDFIHAKMPGKDSIVISSVVAAGEGKFGDYHPTRRTEGTKLFLNHLMSMYWCFELAGVAQRCLYLDYILDTYSRFDVHRALNNYLYTVKPREWLPIEM